MIIELLGYNYWEKILALAHEWRVLTSIVIDISSTSSNFLGLKNDAIRGLTFRIIVMMLYSE
jgi:hypothetical protein